MENTVSISNNQIIKCAICSKSSIYNMECRCNNHFCRKHFDPKRHNCTYDFCKKSIENLENNLQKIDAKKITNI